jgi:hypothetical protein
MNIHGIVMMESICNISSHLITPTFCTYVDQAVNFQRKIRHRLRFESHSKITRIDTFSEWYNFTKQGY